MSRSIGEDLVASSGQSGHTGGLNEKDRKKKKKKKKKGLMISPFIIKFKGALDKYNIILQLFSKKVGVFIPLEVLVWVMTACWVLRSRLTYFWRYMKISSIFYFSKSTSINTQYSSLWDTLKMMLFTKYLIKWKCIAIISWKFRYWFNLKSSIDLDIKRWMSYLSNAPLTISSIYLPFSRF